MAGKLNELFNETDEAGYIIKLWARPTKDPKTIFCNACDKQVKIIRGKFSVNQHVKGTSHQQQCKIKFNQKQLHITNKENNVELFTPSPQQLASKAEIIWTLRTVCRNHSFESVAGLKDIFRTMFPSVEWLQYFSLSPRKVSYLISYGLAPYFMQKLIEDVTGN